jgi:hypothetical protein
MKKAFPNYDCRFSISALFSSATLPEALLLLAKNVVEVEDESTRERGCGQSPRLVQLRKNRR